MTIKLTAKGWTKWHLRVSAVTLLSSAALSLLLPKGAVLHFGGVASGTASTWVRGKGAAELALGVLALRASFGSATLLRVVGQTVGLYGVVEMIAFFVSHAYDQPMSGGLGSIGVGLVGAGILAVVSSLVLEDKEHDK